MPELLRFNRQHHRLFVPRLIVRGLISLVLALGHEESATLRAHVPLGRRRLCNRLLETLTHRRRLDTVISITKRLRGRSNSIALGVSAVPDRQARTRLDHLQLLPHYPVLLLQLLHFFVVPHDFLKLAVLFLEDEQLLMEVVSATFALQIQNVLQVLNLFLELDDKSVISRANLIGTDFGHNLLGPVRKFQRRNCLLAMVDYRADCRDQRRASVAAQAILKQPGDLRVSVRNVSLALALRQTLNDLAECAETQIDGLQLEQVLRAHRVVLMDLLASSEIAQVELATHQHAFRVGPV